MSSGKKGKKPSMKLVFIIYSNPVDEEIIEILREEGAGYSKFVNVQGEGDREPQLGSHIWPGINNCIISAMDETMEKKMSKRIISLKERYQGIGITVFSTGLDSWE